MRRIVFYLFVIQGLILYAQDDVDITLNGEWKLSYGIFDRNTPLNPDEIESRDWPVIPAMVPGNVELDLLAAGEIEDPEIGSNIYDLRKYEAYQWWYSRKFETPGHVRGERIQLVFEGLDCFSRIWINNTLIGKTDNMLIAHRFDITDFLNPTGDNTIYISIDPAIYEGQKHITPAVGVRWDIWVEQLHV